ncbi:MAG: PilZ domain-containing protein [Alphaproteobacteria bacterium]|nr:PilZ domain-containing protein [Alphaproteobacteria bacterium]
MSLMEAPVARREFGLTKPRSIVDGDRIRTVPLALSGRFMRSNKNEFPCQLNEVSVEHMMLTSPVLVSNGEKIIVYLDHLGGLEGEVTRPITGGFHLRLNITTRKREKLAAQLTWLINRAELSGLEARRHDRVTVSNKTVALRYGGDTAVECRLLDISLSGASLETPVRPDVGMEVLVGKQNAIVRRHHEQGIGVEFVQVREANNLQGLVG